MEISTLRKEHKLLDIFCDLVTIPAPSFKEQEVIDRILQIFKENNINAKQDDYGNIIVRIQPTDPSKQMIALSSHLDVVGDDSPINLHLNGNIIETDKTRTLGADDKVGVASAILLAIEITQNKTLQHGGLEIVFTRDEEQTMSGIHNFNMSELNSEHVLVLDADAVGQVQIAGAGYTNVKVKVTTFKGGHSGNDIADTTRLNAVKLISELVSEIPQGVYKQNEFGVITSINAGAIVGGGIESPIQNIKESNMKSNEFYDYILERAVTNVINTKAGITYSLRSSSREYEKNLIDEIKTIVDKFNDKYKNLATATLETSEHLPPFEKSDDNTIPNISIKAGKKIGMDISVSSFHAGAETHIYANSYNKNGKKYKPVLIGLANIYNMHSADEQVDYTTFLKGYEFLKELFFEINS